MITPQLSKNLRRQVAVVTGAAQGLGYAIAHAYAAEGMRLALIDVQAERLARVAAEINAEGGDALAIPADLSDADATCSAINRALDVLGVPRVLVHNAAVLVERSLLETSLSEWQRDVNIILQAAFLLAQAVWIPMTEAGGGSIVLLSSASSLRGFAGEIAYCPAKHGQEGLMKTLAIEGRPSNIAVNTVAPGVPIHTPMSERSYTEELKEDWLDPALITPAFIFLARQDASGVTGQRVIAKAGEWQLTLPT
ncbi:MAG: SDR family oxidoreductase [Chloroflexi bacterium]|nr:SDR family oxidoreductase [Chloroflexota bacterium]